MWHWGFTSHLFNLSGSSSDSMSSGGRGERSADRLNTDKASGVGIKERLSLIVADPTTISAFFSQFDSPASLQVKNGQDSKTSAH